MPGNAQQTDGTPARAAIILAGGRSSRFGSSKASALFLGRTMLDWVIAAASEVASEIIVVASPDSSMLEAAPSRVVVNLVRDPEPFPGPLAGAVTGLQTTEHEYAFMLSCDAPLVQPALLSQLAHEVDGHDAAIPHVADRPQPLVALYRVAPALTAFRTTLQRGERSLIRALDDLDANFVPEATLRHADRHLLSFHNINTPAELAALERRLMERGTGNGEPGGGI